jgi:hypothetical protein
MLIMSRHEEGEDFLLPAGKAGRPLLDGVLFAAAHNETSEQRSQ